MRIVYVCLSRIFSWDEIRIGKTGSRLVITSPSCPFLTFLRKSPHIVECNQRSKSKYNHTIINNMTEMRDACRYVNSTAASTIHANIIPDIHLYDLTYHRDGE